MLGTTRATPNEYLRRSSPRELQASIDKTTEWIGQKHPCSKNCKAATEASDEHLADPSLCTTRT